MELTNEQRNDIAMEIAEYWKYNCSDEEFYDNCKDTICVELEHSYNLKEDNFDKEYRIILNLINEVYSKDNWEALKFFEIGNRIILQYDKIIINDIVFNNVWEIVLEYNKVRLYGSNEKEIANISIYDIINIKRCE